MKFDCIIANPPYGKIGVDITETLINEIPHKDISILGTRSMLGKHNENLSLEYVYIEDYVLNPLCKVKWVRQIILLGHKGSCNVIPSKVNGYIERIMPNEIRVPYPMARNGQCRLLVHPLLTRSRITSYIISVSDEDYEYIREHWNEMNYVERFWWLHDRGLYKRFNNIK